MNSKSFLPHWFFTPPIWGFQETWYIVLEVSIFEKSTNVRFVDLICFAYTAEASWLVCWRVNKFRKDQRHGARFIILARYANCLV